MSHVPDQLAAALAGRYRIDRAVGASWLDRALGDLGRLPAPVSRIDALDLTTLKRAVVAETDVYLRRVGLCDALTCQL